MPLTQPLEEATRKAGACWLDLHDGDGDGPRLLWHAWHEDALWFVCGGGEQALPGATNGGTGTVTVTVTVRARTGEVMSWQGRLEVVPPTSELWRAAAAALHDKRCNAPDGEDQPQRWAATSVLIRVLPG